MTDNNAFNQISNYLKDKILRVNPTNPKANTGARLLYGNEDLVDEALYFACDLLEQLFNSHTNTRSITKGETPLTNVSVKIGAYILDLLDHPETGKPLKISQVRTGDFFIEALLKYEYVNIKAPVSRDTSYTLIITDKWVELAKRNHQGLAERTSLKPYDGFIETKTARGDMIKHDSEDVWCRSAKKLMNVPWRINTPVYEALRADKNRFLPLPDEDATELDWKRWYSRDSFWWRLLRTADEWVGKVFYQRIKTDYRGRVYYMDPNMNIQGIDWSRGFYEFANGKPMTPDGEYWLAIHTAASFDQEYSIDDIPSWCETDYHTYLSSEGLDTISVAKFTLNDRVRWTNENMEVIIDAGRERVFADEAEKPVAFLACCIEWYNISEADGEYISHLPIPIDGSNNGWQHLGAMSRDTQTGELVGLVAKEIQKDFYVQTAKQLLEIDDPKLNAMHMKHIRKGISKRGSMTRAYSAGWATMAKNMWNDCRTDGFDEEYKITQVDCERWAKELIKAINKVCPGPLETMKYMQDLASYEIGTYEKYRDGKPARSAFNTLQKELKDIWGVPAEERDTNRLNDVLDELKKFETVRVKGNGNTKLRWSTPSGFPVVYENWYTEDLKCKGTILGKRITHNLKIYTDRPDVRGFMSGISPNYVHSMDAAHMALVIDQFDGDFGAVHDSFSTHACDVDKLLRVTKETFVDMYDVNNYFNTIRNDITRCTDDIEQPSIGSLEIQEVYDSDYFFA